MKTDDLIDVLAQDAVPRWRFGQIFGIAITVGVLAAAALFFAGIGFRPDIAQALKSARFLFKFVVTITLAVGALGVALRLGRPGAPLGPWRWLLAAVPLLLLLGSVVELSIVPRDAWMAHLVGHNAPLCLTLVPLLSIGPLACSLFALRQGAPARPGEAGAIAGLAASGIAATFYAANCTDDSPLFVTFWYPIAAAMVTVVGACVGKHALKW
jgi:hypothetical protein